MLNGTWRSHHLGICQWLKGIKVYITLEGLIYSNCSIISTFEWAQNANTILRFPCLAFLSFTAYSQDTFSPVKINCGKTCSDKRYKDKRFVVKNPTNHPLTTALKSMEEFTRRDNNAIQCFVGLFLLSIFGRGLRLWSVLVNFNQLSVSRRILVTLLW